MDEVRIPLPLSQRAGTCAAKGCPKTVERRMLMCSYHWRLVPRTIQKRVWANYRDGQENTGHASANYFKAMTDAVDAVTAKEARHHLSQQEAPLVTVS